MSEIMHAARTTMQKKWTGILSITVSLNIRAEDKDNKDEFTGFTEPSDNTTIIGC